MKRSHSRRACELKHAQYSMQVVHLYRWDPAEIIGTLKPKVEAAPALLGHAPVVVDLHAPQLEAPSAADLKALLDDIAALGLRPIALSTRPDLEPVADELGWPRLARGAFAHKAPIVQAELELEPMPENEATPVAEPAATAAAVSEVTATQPAQLHRQPVRGGQRLYARNRDLMIVGAVNPGGEAIADGSIQVYGRLAGRALAGARGAADAFICCQQFAAELVSICGVYRVFEEPDPQWSGRATIIRLVGDSLKFEPL